MKEYNVSLRKPNKRFSIKSEDRIIRIKDYLQNIWTVRKYFLDTYLGCHSCMLNEVSNFKIFRLFNEKLFSVNCAKRYTILLW